MKTHDELQDAKLQELAQRLGVLAAERLDVQRTAQAVLARLREQPRSERWAWAELTWLRIAAAVVLLLGAGVVTRSALHRPGRTVSNVVVPIAEDLSDLSADQLQGVLKTLDQQLEDENGWSPETGLEGLTAPQLRALLRSLEG